MIASAIMNGKRRSDMEISSLLGALPHLLETQETLEHDLIMRQNELIARDKLIHTLFNSRSWKMTSPLRTILAGLRTIFSRR